jgi:hypothetical protein
VGFGNKTLTIHVRLLSMCVCYVFSRSNNFRVLNTKGRSMLKKFDIQSIKLCIAELAVLKERGRNEMKL